MTEAKTNDDKKDPALFKEYLLRPDQVMNFWDSTDPNKAASKLILEHLEDESDRTGQDWQSWD